MSTDKSAVTGDVARQNVHSAIIINQTSNKIHCFVEYQTLLGMNNEISEFDVDSNGEERKCEEKVHSAGTHTHDSSFSNVYPKVISSLQIKRSDGSTDKIVAPFDNVPHESVRNWKFIVTNDGIHSEKS
jgi:hypothetical protein